MQTKHSLTIARLIRKIHSAELTAKERVLIDKWIAEDERNKQLFLQLTDPEYLNAQELDYLSTEEADWEELKSRITNHVHPVRSWRYYARYAAVIFLPALLLTLYFIYKKDSSALYKNEVGAISKINKPILPGSKRAILVLGDGSRVELEKGIGKDIAASNHISLNRQSDILVYADRSTSSLKKQIYNTIIIPKGGEYQLVLSDGTKIWMNSESQIRYPVNFNGPERRVYLKGEAYFEVAKNARAPFFVQTQHAQVRVLGTHFAVTDYDDGQLIKTTLLEGSVKMKSGKSEVKLVPGQQGRLGDSGRLELVNDVDVLGEIAWKSGLFQFKDTDIDQVMRQVSRWYDVDFLYTGGIPNIPITGRISRNVDLGGVLDILKFAGVKLRLDGRTIKISN